MSNMISEKKLQIIIDLLEVTEQIIKIYEKLIIYELINNQEEYQKNISYLKLCIDLEKDIYKKLKITLENSEYIMDTILIQNKLRKNLEENLKELVVSRIQEQISFQIDPTMINPYQSVEKSEEENVSIIINQYFLDVDINTYLLLEEKIKTEPNLNIKEEYIREKYTIIVSLKILEQAILISKNIESIQNRKEKCLIFGHNKELVDKTYLMATIEYFQNTILNLIENNQYLETDQNITNLYIIALLSLHNEEEIQTIYQEILEFLETNIDKNKLNEETNNKINDIINICQIILNDFSRKKKVLNSK